MSIYIRAKVLSSSEDDPKFRVKVFCPNIYDPESPLLEVLGQVPLHPNDIVIVDTSLGTNNALIIGKCFTASQQSEVSYQVLFHSESNDGSNWIEAGVKSDSLVLSNSNGVTVSYCSSEVKINANEAHVVINGGCNSELINISQFYSKLSGFEDKFNNHSHSVALAGAIILTSPGTPPGSTTITGATITIPGLANYPNETSPSFVRSGWNDSNVMH